VGCGGAGGIGWLSKLPKTIKNPPQRNTQSIKGARGLIVGESLRALLAGFK